MVYCLHIMLELLQVTEVLLPWLRLSQLNSKKCKPQKNLDFHLSNSLCSD